MIQVCSLAHWGTVVRKTTWWNGIGLIVHIMFTKSSYSQLSTGFHPNCTFDIGLCYMSHNRIHNEDHFWTDVWFQRLLRHLLQAVRPGWPHLPVVQKRAFRLFYNPFPFMSESALVIHLIPLCLHWLQHTAISFSLSSHSTGDSIVSMNKYSQSHVVLGVQLW